MNRRYIFVIGVIVCLGCKECPPCPGDDMDSTDTETTTDIPDTAADDSAAEFKISSGAQPKNVTAYELHGRAGFDRVSIWSKPDMDSPRLGYLRKGQRMMVGNPEYATEGCPKGWFKLKQGGFVCQGRGMLVGTKPRFIRNPPPKPLVDELDPYRHGFVRSDFTPSYKRVPAKEQLWVPPERYVPGEYNVFIPYGQDDDRIDTAPKTTTDDTDSDTILPVGQHVVITVDPTGELLLPAEVSLEKDEDGNLVLPPGAKIPTEIVPHQTRRNDEATPEDNEDNETIPGIDYNRYAKAKFPIIREFLMRGFWISVARRLRDDATRQFYYETISGDYVPANAIHMIRPPTFHGYRVLGDSPLPAAIVRTNHAAFFAKRRRGFGGIGPVDKLNVYRVLGDASYRGVSYYEIGRERYLKGSQVAYFELREPPDGILDNEKWIRIDLTHQTLEAYEGTTPVFVTLISSGLPDEEDFVTPNGEFRIEFKHLTDNMEGSVGDGEDAYSVADVPWAQYFHRNIALHAAFWHSKYGQPKSHGCVNLSPADARFLFDWTDPVLPEGWHGIAATTDTPGTKVFVVGTTPQ